MQVLFIFIIHWLKFQLSCTCIGTVIRPRSRTTDVRSHTIGQRPYPVTLDIRSPQNFAGSFNRKPISENMVLTVPSKPPPFPFFFEDDPSELPFPLALTTPSSVPLKIEIVGISPPVQSVSSNPFVLRNRHHPESKTHSISSVSTPLFNQQDRWWTQQNVPWSSSPLNLEETRARSILYPQEYDDLNQKQPSEDKRIASELAQELHHNYPDFDEELEVTRFENNDELLSTHYPDVSLDFSAVNSNKFVPNPSARPSIQEDIATQLTLHSTGYVPRAKIDRLRRLTNPPKQEIRIIDVRGSKFYRLPSRRAVLSNSVKLDKHEFCCYWARIHECTRNPYFMTAVCPESCRLNKCKDETNCEPNVVVNCPYLGPNAKPVPKAYRGHSPRHVREMIPEDPWKLQVQDSRLQIRKPPEKIEFHSEEKYVEQVPNEAEPQKSTQNLSGRIDIDWRVESKSINVKPAPNIPRKFETATFD